MSGQSNVVHIAPTPAVEPWIVIDLETGDAPEEAIQAAIERWKAPANWKPETVSKNRAEYAAKARDKAALLDASTILCVGLRSPQGGVMLSGMGVGHLDTIPGWIGVLEYQDEAGLLAGLRAVLDATTDAATVLVGHNIRGFDAPKLRGAYVRHRLPLPRCLRPVEGGPGQPLTDTMRLFGHFSMEYRDAPFVGLDTVCRAFGIPRPKSVVSGAEVPEMHRDGRFAEILTYCAIDVDATAEVYRRMMA